jgi:hypothetical protein
LGAQRSAEQPGATNRDQILSPRLANYC